MFKPLNISKMCYIIQRLNSYNLLIYKVAEKDPRTNYRPDKKAKKVTERIRKKMWNLLTQIILFTDQ